MGARGVVHGVMDKKVRDLSGDAGARVRVLRSDHPHAPAVVLPFEQDASAHQGRTLGVDGFDTRVRGSGVFRSKAKPVLLVDGGLDTGCRESLLSQPNV